MQKTKRGAERLRGCRSCEPDADPLNLIRVMPAEGEMQKPGHDQTVVPREILEHAFAHSLPVPAPDRRRLREMSRNAVGALRVRFGRVSVCVVRGFGTNAVLS